MSVRSWIDSGRYFASYSSAKSGLRAFSEALRRELAGSEIAVTHVSPRAVKTPFLTPEIEKYIELTKMNVDDAEPVAAAIVDAIKRKRKELFIGFPGVHVCPTKRASAAINRSRGCKE